MPPTPDFDPATAALIRGKAAQLVGHADWRPQDFPDLVQELAMALLTRRAAHDPARGPWLAFARVVVGQAAAKSVRTRQAGKRDYRRGRAWHEGAGAERAVRRWRREQDVADLLVDVADLLQQLPPELGAVADCLKKGQTVAAAARTLGVRRTTLYGRLRQLRERFAALAP